MKLEFVGFIDRFWCTQKMGKCDFKDLHIYSATWFWMFSMVTGIRLSMPTIAI